MLQKIDALVTELNMPEADGLVVALTFRGRYPENPIIMMTASPMTDERISSFLEIPQTAVFAKAFWAFLTCGKTSQNVHDCEFGRGKVIGAPKE